MTAGRLARVEGKRIMRQSANVDNIEEKGVDRG